MAFSRGIGKNRDMTNGARTWRVGIIGVNPVGLFLFERIKLARDTRVVGVFDHDSSRLRLASDLGCELWDRPTDAFDTRNVDVVFLMGCGSADTISEALRHGKHVVIDQPWLLSAGQLRSLYEQSKAVNCVATVATIRRLSADFVTAELAKQTGRLGTLQSARLSSCEQELPAEDRPIDLMREIGFQWFDQLLVLVESTPRLVFARRLRDADPSKEHGFVSTIEFTNGCTAQIEIRTRTRLSHRTGWMLEGLTGSYRGERLFTTTPDGEIVDEPLLRPEVSDDLLVRELESAWQGKPSTLSTLADAARVVDLLEAVELSAGSGETVSL